MTARAKVVRGHEFPAPPDDARNNAAVAASIVDHSDVFTPLRLRVTGPDGQTYRELRAGLDARWPQVWAELGASVAAVALVPIVSAWLERKLARRGAVVAPVAAVAVGTAVHRLGHFLHEGAHFNVAPTKSGNDRLTNATVGVVVLTDVRSYRPIHMTHHRTLGTADDPERSYLEPLNARFVARGLSGTRVLFSMRQRLAADDTAGARPSKAVPLIGALGHGAVVGALALRGRRATAAAWAIGVGGVYPLLNSTRQLLEHRPDPPASPAPGTRAVTRMFTTGPLSSVIGGIGFNRHLLHHWDPSVSYTRLPELEQRLRPTAAGEIVAARDGTYGTTLRRMWRAGRTP